MIYELSFIPKTKQTNKQMCTKRVNTIRNPLREKLHKNNHHLIFVAIQIPAPAPMTIPSAKPITGIL